MSANILENSTTTLLQLPHQLRRKARASDQEGAREVLRALNRTGQDKKLTRVDRAKLVELLEALERETKLLARLRDDQGDRSDLVTSEVIMRIFWFRDSWVRPPRTFRRSSHNPFTQLKELIRHLFERYPTPRFLLNSFVEQNRYSGIYVMVARGVNVRKIERFRPVLTKTQAHLFHTMKDEGISIRQAGVLAMCRSYGVAEEVARALIRNRHVLENNFSFWGTFMEFLGRQHMVNPSEIGPLCDYLHHHRVLPRTHPDQPRRIFSFQGRTLLALLERMNDWHDELAQRKKQYARSWEPESYFTQLRLDENNHGWQIHEILTEKDLRSEGARMRHCVYSYLQDCLKRRSRIFSMVRLTDGHPYGERRLTLELYRINDKKHRYELFQARGKCNRDPTEEEDAILQAWAKDNNILANDYKW